jgi:hypothetical protein
MHDESATRAVYDEHGWFITKAVARLFVTKNSKE